MEQIELIYRDRGWQSVWRFVCERFLCDLLILDFSRFNDSGPHQEACRLAAAQPGLPVVCAQRGHHQRAALPAPWPGPPAEGLWGGTAGGGYLHPGGAGACLERSGQVTRVECQGLHASDEAGPQRCEGEDMFSLQMMRIRRMKMMMVKMMKTFIHFFVLSACSKALFQPSSVKLRACSWMQTMKYISIAASVTEA